MTLPETRRGGRARLYFGMDKREANTVAATRLALKKSLGIEVDPMRVRLVMAALHGCSGMLRHVHDTERIAICKYLLVAVPKSGTYTRRKKKKR